jgi:hypothetical protein
MISLIGRLLFQVFQRLLALQGETLKQHVSPENLSVLALFFAVSDVSMYLYPMR